MSARVLRGTLLAGMAAAVLLLAGCDRATKEKMLAGTLTSAEDTGLSGSSGGTGGTLSAAQSTAVVNQFFSSGMSAYGGSSSVFAPGAGGAAINPVTVQINQSVNQTVTGPLGGRMIVTGSITGSFSENGGTLLIGLTETITDYKFSSGGVTFTVNGAPYISAAGTFTVTASGSFGTASSLRFGGGFTVSGGGVSQTCNINVTVILNSSGSGGSISGTVCGESINSSF